MADIKEEKFGCKLCIKAFVNNKGLRKHVKNIHGECHLPDVERRGRKVALSALLFSCSVCSRTFANPNNVNRHMREKHIGAKSTDDHASADHLSSTNTLSVNPSVLVPAEQGDRHDTEPSNITVKSFSSVADFMEWKGDEEERTCSRFVKQTRDFVRSDGYIRRYFTCHRSGIYRSRGRSKRRLKFQGSNKIGRKCPAFMKTLISSEGQVQVTYRSDHQGHKCDFAHLSLLRKHRLQIAGMLAAGIPMDDVINQLQAEETELTCLHFLTKRDMRNIMRDFNISKGDIQHRNDETMPAIPGMSSKQQQTSLSLAEEYCDCILAELQLHPEIAPTICKELRGLRAKCSALIARPQMPTVFPQT